MKVFYYEHTNSPNVPIKYSLYCLKLVYFEVSVLWTHFCPFNTHKNVSDCISKMVNFKNNSSNAQIINKIIKNKIRTSATTSLIDNILLTAIVRQFILTVSCPILYFPIGQQCVANHTEHTDLCCDPEHIDPFLPVDSYVGSCSFFNAWRRLHTLVYRYS